VGAAFVCVGPAGVEVAHEYRLVGGVALVFMHFTHDKVLDISEQVCLIQVGEVFEW